jgi:hypothetical protein
MTQVPERNYDYWLDRCRAAACTGKFIKLAELGGDGQDAPFEQSFSNLAHAYLRDSAPSLLDHEVGFQLLDRNQENTKAVGVFAFKVGSQSLYAPVFFLQGNLKGHELLYMKDQDMFVPLKENWLNYILNRKPNILGTGVSRQTSQMGVMQPDLNRLSQSPGKYASVKVASSIEPFMPLLAHLATSDFGKAITEFEEHCATRLDLEHFMKQASLPVLQQVSDMFRRKPKVAAAFDKWHGIGMLIDAVKQAKARLDTRSVLDNPYPAVNRNQTKAAGHTGSVLDWMEKTGADGDKGPDYQGKLEIITIDMAVVSDVPEGLDDADKEKLLKDTVLIKDHRDGEEVSVPCTIAVEQKLTNPSETGVYEVLTKIGEFEKCLVIIDPHGPDGRKHFVTVVRLDESTRNWGNFPRNEVWVAGQSTELLGGSESWMEWFDSLSDTSSLSVESKSRYTIVGPRRNATCPFRVKHEIGDKSYEVDFADDCHSGSNLSMGYRSYDSYRGMEQYNKYVDGQRLHLDSKTGTDLRSNGGDVYIPQGFKVLKLSPTASDKAEDDKDSMVMCCGDNDKSDPPPIQPGKLVDATMYFRKKTAALRIENVGELYRVNGSRAVSKTAALIHLVREHGLREEVSRHLLKEASTKRGLYAKPFECHIKYANPYMIDEGPSAPAMPEPEMNGYNPMGFNGPTMMGQSQEMVVPGMEASNTDPMTYNVNPANQPDPMDANTVNRAAATGQKEVFDTAMIGSMLKAVRDDTMIDRYLPDLVKGLDRLARILFMFYWHQDRFAERYGKQDLPELEDSLRNTFESIGDVVLFLKQKTIEPYPEESTQDINLGAIAT